MDMKATGAAAGKGAAHTAEAIEDDIELKGVGVVGITIRLPKGGSDRKCMSV